MWRGFALRIKVEPLSSPPAKVPGATTRPRGGLQAVRFDGVRVAFVVEGGAYPAIERADLGVNAGEFVAIVGAQRLRQDHASQSRRRIDRAVVGPDRNPRPAASGERGIAV